MKLEIIINKLIPRAFSMLKVNLNLAMPLLLFLLIFVIIISPIAGINGFLRFAVIAMLSVFLAGWFKMFDSCIDNSDNENLPVEKKALDSLNLYNDFFPGVGKYFIKILLGSLIFIIIINIAELIIIKYIVNFKISVIEKYISTFSSQTDVISFWNKIPSGEKLKLYQLAMYNMAFFAGFSYLTMFWPQFIIVENKNPLNAFWLSVKTVLFDPINTFFMYIILLFGLFLIFIINIAAGNNFIIQLLVLMMFVYFLVYYVMMTFLYFKRYR